MDELESNDELLSTVEAKRKWQEEWASKYEVALDMDDSTLRKKAQAALPADTTNAIHAVQSVLLRLEHTDEVRERYPLTLRVFDYAKGNFLKNDFTTEEQARTAFDFRVKLLDAQKKARNYRDILMQ